MAAAYTSREPSQASEVDSIPVAIPPHPSGISQPDYLSRKETEGTLQATNGADSQDAPRWASEALSRRAVGLLLLNDHYDEARRILLQMQSGTGRALSMDRPSHKPLLRCLQPTLSLEAFRLRNWYGRLSQANRLLLFGQAEQERMTATEAFLSSDLRMIHLDRVGRALPNRLLIRYIRNVHAELAAVTEASDDQISLLLGLAFPSGRPFAAAYWRNPESQARFYDSLLPDWVSRTPQTTGDPDHE